MKTQLTLFFTFFCIVQSVCAQTWNALGPGLNGSVAEILPHDQRIYVCGNFTDAGGDPDADKIALWDGTTWHSVAPISNTNYFIKGMAIHDNDIYVIRSLNLLEGFPNHDDIARWNGSSWETLGTFGYSSIHDIVRQGDVIYIAGTSRLAVGTPDFHFIRYLEGDDWIAMNTTNFDFDNPYIGIVSLAADDQNLYVAGNFFLGPRTDNVRNIARWNGESWFPLDNGFWGDMGVSSIAIDGNNVYATGDGGAYVASCGITRWDGKDWSPLGLGLSHCLYGEGGQVVAAASGKVYVAGNFLDAGDIPNTTGLAHWDGSTWSALGSPGFEFGQYPGAIANAGEDVYVGGSFLQIAGVPNTSYIARWGEPTVVAEVTELGDNNQHSLSIYPNPIERGVVSYQIDNAVLLKHMVTIFDATGRVILQKESDARELNIERLPAGLYLLQIECGAMSGVGRFVKE